MVLSDKKNTEDEFKSVSASLYKQNLEIATKNKTLSLLGKLYEISLLSLAPKDLALKMAAIVQAELSLELAGIFLYNPENDTLEPLGAKVSERLNDLEAKYQYFFESTVLKDISSIPFFQTIFQNKTKGYTESLLDIWSLADKSIFKKVEEEGHVRSSISYPLILNGKIIGVLILSLNRKYADIGEHEKASFDSIIDVITVGLDKAILYEELKEANERQEGLIHFISHEVKGFLTKNLAVFAGIKEGDFGQTTPQLVNAAEYGLADTRKGVNTVMDILNASNLKKGTTTYTMKEFDLKQSVQEIVDSLKGEATTKGLNYDLELCTDDLSAFKGDREQIEKHVFRNLIDNSIKYTPEGSLKIKLEKFDGKVLFSVKDTGVGLSDEDKKKLFTEGGRGKDSTLINVNSTGYGLFIAKSIVVAHKGTIWAESEGKGKGSTFFVELPCLQ